MKIMKTHYIAILRVYNSHSFGHFVLKLIWNLAAAPVEMHEML